MAFPATRMRRLRRTGLLRGMVRETELTPAHLVLPLFVELGTDSRTPIEAMPGVDRLSISHAVEEASAAQDLGVPAVLGPSRGAGAPPPPPGARRSYQMDPANADEAVREALLDMEEGADVVMVKPALPYLDVVRRVKEATRLPVAAYNVSGEYAMVKAATAAGYIDERAAVLEALTGIRRAGADIVITYHARDVAEWLS